eukprot:9004844-Pyramimonas_sp.AAC.1
MVKRWHHKNEWNLVAIMVGSDRLTGHTKSIQHLTVIVIAKAIGVVVVMIMLPRLMLMRVLIVR